MRSSVPIQRYTGAHGREIGSARGGLRLRNGFNRPAGPRGARAHAAHHRPARGPLDSLYWADRHAYDEGKLTGVAYWQGLAREAGLISSPAAIEKLDDWDARMWTTRESGDACLAATLKQRGLLTAIVSNMGDTVHEHVQREFGGSRASTCWYGATCSAWPSPIPPSTATCSKSSDAARGNAFHRRQAANVEARRRLGMRGHQFFDRGDGCAKTMGEPY